MKIPVLLAVPGQEPLRESASAAFEGRDFSNIIRAAEMPKRFSLDRGFSAMPLGSIERRMFTADVMQPQNSEDFAVRGTIDVDRVEDVPEEIEGARVFSDARIAPFPYCAAAAKGKVSDVRTALDVPGLAAKGLDGEDVAIAIVDSGINLSHLSSQIGSMPALDAANSWKPPGATHNPGQYPTGHGTMCAFDALIAAPKATLLDYPVLQTSMPGGTITGQSISAALQAFAHLLANYAVAFAPGGTGRYNGLVVSNSWGVYHPSWDFPAGHPGRYCDNPKHPFRQIVNALTLAGADVVFAAGNCGSECPKSDCQNRTTGSIMGASAYEDVLTVAACLVTNNERLGYSSQGPSIAGMPQEKPDVTSYAHFVGSETKGSGKPDTGTSTACPIVSGCLAAIRTKRFATVTPPANMIRQVQMTAKQVTGTPAGWNADYGHGIIQPVDLASSLGL